MTTAGSGVDRIRIGGIPIDRVKLDGALDVIATLVEQGAGGSVFTPNVDHIVMASENPRFFETYQEVSLSLADGMPVVWAARLLGAPVPEKVSGSDLVEPLVGRAAAKGWRVFLLGGNEGVAVEAAARLTARVPGLSIVGTASPRVNMDDAPGARDEVHALLAAARADLVLVAFGAPKQELFIREARSRSKAVFVGIGASLDFIAGTTRRAPRWMSNVGLEWAFRLAQDPKRLATRYLVRDPRFVVIFGRDLLATARGEGARAYPAKRRS